MDWPDDFVICSDNSRHICNGWIVPHILQKDVINVESLMKYSFEQLSGKFTTFVVYPVFTYMAHVI